MADLVLITGGAGFIGAHLAATLVDGGAAVRVLDDLLPQVHGECGRPVYLSDDVELVRGDIRDATAVRKALIGVDSVVHLCARVGVGQSMYEIAEYSSVNTHGTAVLLEALLEHPVDKLVVASSMSIYGEGLYRDASGSPAPFEGRSRSQLERGDWEPAGADGGPLEPVATPETKVPSLTSIYALNKYEQERMCLLFG